MRFKKYIIEKSFVESDIPRVFRVAIEWGYDEKKFDTLKQLEKMELKGLTGISEAGDLIFQWVGAGRDILLIMNGKEVVELNKISRFLYDNPHYMLSNNMKWLRRMYQRGEGQDNRGVLFNLNEQIFLSLAEKGYITKYDISYSAPHQTMADTKVAKTVKINGVKDYIKYFRRAYREASIEEAKATSWRKYSFSGKSKEGHTAGFEELFDNISDSEFSTVVQHAFERIKKIYGGEGEWVVKTKTLTIPKKSYLYILELADEEEIKKYKENPKQIFSDYSRQRIEQWIRLKDGIDKKLKGKYIVKYFSQKEFKRVQTIHFSRGN